MREEEPVEGVRWLAAQGRSYYARWLLTLPFIAIPAAPLFALINGGSLVGGYVQAMGTTLVVGIVMAVRARLRVEEWTAGQPADRTDP